MKLYCTTNKQTYEIAMSGKGNILIVCPVCNLDRKKSNLKPLSFDMNKKCGKCHHCEATFVEYKELQQIQHRVEQKNYKRPNKPELKSDLSDKFLRYFETRGISPKTIRDMQITEQVEFMPQPEQKRNCICFNYYRGEELINIKFRDGAKNFKLFGGGELIPYNLNGITDTAIWCEGEFDQLSFYECGYKFALSVPNGAGKTTQNLSYIENCFDEIDRITLHYIATDDDEPGRALRDELIRRFGAENCRIITFDECKDANEYLVRYGKDGLIRCFESAKFAPLDGIYSIKENRAEIIDLWRNGMQRGFEIHHPELNKLVSWVSGVLAVWTGIPSMGKSEMVDEVCEQLNVLYGWKVAYYSPENHPVKTHIAKIASRLVGKHFNSQCISFSELEQTIEYIEDNFFFISPSDDDTSIESILRHAKSLIKRNGIKCLVIDPWNKLDHRYTKGESETQYISRALDQLTVFAQRNDVLIHLVAHPTKIRKDPGTMVEPCPNLYDISGSAHFYNKAFYGFAVHREGEFTIFNVLKVKFRHLGEPRGGKVTMRYNFNNGRYAEYNDVSIQWDNRSHLLFEKEDMEFAPSLNSYEKEEITDIDKIPF